MLFDIATAAVFLVQGSRSDPSEVLSAKVALVYDYRTLYRVVFTWEVAP
jgi:hypothetical protein